MKETSRNTEGSSLELLINIESNKFSMNLFVKGDVVLFSNCRMPCFTRNIPSKIFYSAYRAGILMISRVTATKTDFINHCFTHISRMISQGGNIKSISMALPKTFRNFETFSNIFTTSLEFVECICTRNKHTWLF